MKKLMLITTGNSMSGMNLPQKALHQSYAGWVQREGMLPLLALSCRDADQLAEQFDALLLTGGEDIAPARYGEEQLADCGQPDNRRDDEELALLDAFVRRKKSVLGVCRGLQVINVYFGGSLYQDLPSQCGVNHSGGVFHAVYSEQSTRLGAVLGNGMQVNSFHHQSIKKLGAGLVACAAAADGVVEAACHETLPVYGVQWHPERMEAGANSRSLFDLLR